MTKLQFRVLYHEFLSRMVDVELLSGHARGDASTLLGQFAALLVFISLGMSMAAIGFADARLPPAEFLIASWSAEHFLIATTMLVVGLFAVLRWESTFPDRRDVMVLAPLPIRPSTLFLAKLAAAATALSLAVLALHLLAGLAWPLVLNRWTARQTIPTLTSDPAMAPVKAADMQSVLDRDLPKILPPGAGLAIGVSQHGVRRVFVYGTARPDSLFEIGSITKTFTGLILARMVEQGKVRFDQPVRELLPPGLVEKPAGREITLLDLATHHSGLPRIPTNFHPADQSNPYADYHAADLYEYLAKRGLRKPADAAFLYSNLGVGLLGQALANRAQMSYPDLVKAEITGPLGMRDTVVSLSPEQQARFLEGRNADGHPVRSWDLDALAGAGALRSTAGDMLTYLGANLHPDSAVVASHRLRADIEPGVRIALAWMYSSDQGTYRHGGATAGYTADAFFNPKDDCAAIVLSNTGPGALFSADLTAEHIRQRLAGLPAVSIASVSIPARGGFLGMIRLFAVYWITMLASGAFIFCCVLGVQGLAAQLLPRRLFLRVSACLQLAAACLLMSVYFLQPMLAMPSAILDAQTPGPPAWLPSYWFLGLFQQLNGSPALAPLAMHAWAGLGIAIGATAAAYALSYFRTLRQIAEEPDIVPGSHGRNWLPKFGNPVETAVVQFSIRTLLRSRQHRVVLAFYLGIGFASTIFFLKSPVARQISTASAADPWHQPSMPLLAASILLMGFWVLGVRVVFSLPLELHANWIFRISPLRAGSELLAARRRSLLVLSVLPVWLASAALFLSIWSWRAALSHLAILALLGLILSEFCLAGARKIPFTCSWLPGKSNFHITFWMCVALIVQIIGRAAEYERRALGNRTAFLTLLAVLAVLAVCARLRTKSEDTALAFEEIPSWKLVTLELPRHPA
jgi:CubicO group peptidase (beta-lactamase class C family)